MSTESRKEKICEPDTVSAVFRPYFIIQLNHDLVQKMLIMLFSCNTMDEGHLQLLIGSMRGVDFSENRALKISVFIEIRLLFNLSLRNFGMYIPQIQLDHLRLLALPRKVVIVYGPRRVSKATFIVNSLL